MDRYTEVHTQTHATSLRLAEIITCMKVRDCTWAEHCFDSICYCHHANMLPVTMTACWCLEGIGLNIEINSTAEAAGNVISFAGSWSKTMLDKFFWS